MFLWAPMEGCFWLYSRPFKNSYFPIESARVHSITLIFATFMYVLASNLTKIKVELNLYPIFRSFWSFLSLPELQVRVFSLLVIIGQNLKPLSHAEGMLKIRWGSNRTLEGVGVWSCKDYVVFIVRMSKNSTKKSKNSEVI